MSDKLLELIKRRHPDYAEKLPHWDFVESTYDGGRAWFGSNIFRYVKEGEKEFSERVRRAYRFNHTKQVVDLVDKYLFRQCITRKEDAPDSLKNFWKKATRSGLSMDVFAKRISAATSKFGRVWIVVDSTAQPGATLTRSDEKKGVAQVYAYIVRPQEMLDMSFDELGQLNWCLIEEAYRNDADPLNSSGNYSRRFRLWTRKDWSLYELGRTSTGADKVRKIGGAEHTLGVVPVIPADHVFTEQTFSNAGLIDDIAYLDRANANYLSNLDAIIQDQTFSQLAMPAQGVLPGETGYDKLIEMGTKRVFLYNGDAGMAPAYISPDPKQAAMILAAIGKIVNEIYHSVGLTGERTQEDNGGGIDNASGVAKAYDFERVNSLLTSKADALQVTERRIAALVALYAGDEGKVGDDNELIAYPREFDTRGLYDEFEIGARLNLLAAPEKIRRKQMSQLMKKLFPAATDAEIAEMEASIEDWSPDDLLGLGASTKPGGPIAAAGNQKTAKELAA